MNKRVRVKPSKGQSIIGFIVGVLFCGLGFFIAIPMFSWFGIIWTLFAVIITVVNALNIWTNNGIATHEIIVDEDNGNEKSSTEKRLNEARCLYEKELITKDEYDEKRKQIINKM